MTTEVFVFTKNASVGAWSRYLFPFPVHEYRQLADNLYIRSGDDILRVSEDTNQDFQGDDRASYFDGYVWWPWLDMGMPGGNKRLSGFDIVCDGVPTVSFGFNQLNLSMFTSPYTLTGDTLTGGIIPMPMTFPSVSFKVKFTGQANNFWSLYAANLYVNDNRIRS